MDDMFGQKPIEEVLKEEAWHKAQRRRQYDTIRICNPTDKDHYVMYDTNQYQRVPANSTIDVPRHIAIRYVNHKKDEIINDMAQKMHDDFIAERRLKGFPDYKDKASENAETYETASFPKTNDLKLMEEIISKLWVGIVAEYGRDLPPHEVNPRSGEVDLTPAVDRILESFSNRRVDLDDKQVMYTPVPTPAPTSQPTYTPPVAPTAAAGSPFSKLNETLAKRITPEDVTL